MLGTFFKSIYTHTYYIRRHEKHLSRVISKIDIAKKFQQPHGGTCNMPSHIKIRVAKHIHMRENRVVSGHLNPMNFIFYLTLSLYGVYVLLVKI